MLHCVRNLISWTFVFSAPLTLLIFRCSFHACIYIARQLDRVSVVTANVGFFTVDIVALFDQSYVALGNKPEPLQLLYNVHVRIVYA